MCLYYVYVCECIMCVCVCVYNVFVCVYVCVVYHMKADGWVKVCKEDVSELIHKYRKDMF